MSESETRPLAGHTVLDLSAGLPGPYCTQILADLGASVIKVERPGGDYLSSIDDTMVRAYSRGKSRVEIDLKAEEGLRQFWSLLASADVLVEGMRPGVMDRLGVSASEVRERFPHIVYCSISGYGQDGPWRDRPGHDLNYLALAGALVGHLTDETMTPALPVADLASGALAAAGILAALVGRSHTGEGVYIDLGMHDVALDWTSAWSGNLNQRFPAHWVFAGSDGARFTVGAIEDHFWARLCRALGDPRLTDLAGLDVTARTTRHDEIRDVLGEIFGTRPGAHWHDLLVDADVPVGEVLDFPSASASDHVRERGVLTDGVRYRPAFPAKWDGRTLRADSED